MNIAIQKNTEEITIKIIGRLDTTTSPDFNKIINEDIADTDNLVLDFEKLDYISSAGLRVLLYAQKKMQKLGTMKLINVCEDVMEVFEMTGFSDILTIR
ncbi:MAG: STAS domain-containing protein [Lachnospiraceae bacterium]|nr:STAS domain-containing protein [Lachnospiraceae bacterium]